ncbi:ATP-binding protein [Streptomyces sp. NPDC005551]|uniref:sensor histidine kinase n=1 Tax=Streptomyces sp. NPDC005551 TaxID=3364725 RepID=UPI0036B51200
MSHLRAPAARADRREGGRHGRPAARATLPLPETHIRSQLLRLAVLPPIAVALSACAAVLFMLRTAGARPSPGLYAVLAGAVGVALAGIVIAAVAADRAARTVGERVGALRRTTARGQADLRALLETLRRGEPAPARRPRGGPPPDADEFELLAADLVHAQDGAATAVVQAAQLSSHTGSEQKVEVFVNLARRLQSLVHREISILDELENEIEDPDLLKGLFHVDHLATRIRRHAENLAVLGGAVSRRQWSNPVTTTEVLRSAIAEVEQYSRVKLVPPIDGTLRGHAVADVIHLLAELVENATVFSAPHTQVLLRASLVTSGLAVEVEDRGLGMPTGEQNKMNALLADPDQVNVASLLQDGRIGLFVVSQLARRHGIHVRLQTNIYGGVQAVLVVPQALLGTGPESTGAIPRTPPREAVEPPRAGAGPERPTVTGPAPEPSAPRHAASASPPRQTREHREPEPAGGAPAPLSRDDGGPAPLPLRDARQERPTPAAAVPGVRPEDRRTVARNAITPPVPRNGVVRGTMGRPPQLPRRRSQEHIAPQLRDGPVSTSRPDDGQHVGHDPGLMAAFQRGIGLAEAAQLEPDHPQPDHPQPGRMGPGHVQPERFPPDHMEPDPVEPDPMEPGHLGPTHAEGVHMEQVHTDTSAVPGARHLGTRHLDGPFTDAPHQDPPRHALSYGGPPRPAPVSPFDAPSGPGAPPAPAPPGADPLAYVPEGLSVDDARPGPDAPHTADDHSVHASGRHGTRAAREIAPAPGPGFTTRHDGSAPAG